jgi:chemotaxis signal transduction protein
MARKVELVVFQVGQKVLALPLSQVEHIHSLCKERGKDWSAHDEFFYFQEKAISWHPLWELLQEPSLYQELETLIEMLPQRRQDHINWMLALEESLKLETPFTKPRNPRECAFGKWYYTYKTENEWIRLHLDAMESPHANIHALADQLIPLARNTNKETALNLFQEKRNSTLASLLNLFEMLQNLLIGLIRKEALIVNDGKTRYALGLDKVLDVFAIESSAIHPTRMQLGPLTPQGFLVDKSNQDSLIPILEVTQLLKRSHTMTSMSMNDQPYNNKPEVRQRG